MSRFHTLIGTTVVAGLVGWSSPAAAQPGSPRAGDEPARRIASVAPGLIEGFVMDERDPEDESFAVRVLRADTVMNSDADRARLAGQVLHWLEQWDK